MTVGASEATGEVGVAGVVRPRTHLATWTQTVVDTVADSAVGVGGVGLEVSLVLGMMAWGMTGHLEQRGAPTAVPVVAGALPSLAVGARPKPRFLGRTHGLRGHPLPLQHMWLPPPVPPPCSGLGPLGPVAYSAAVYLPLPLWGVAWECLAPLRPHPREAEAGVGLEVVEASKLGVVDWLEAEDVVAEVAVVETPSTSWATLLLVGCLQASLRRRAPCLAYQLVVEGAWALGLGMEVKEVVPGAVVGVVARTVLLDCLLQTRPCA